MIFEWTILDTWIVATAAMCGMACALLGNFLVLRKISLMGDAISHALLPGIVVAFLLTGSRASWPMFVGAACAGVLTAWLAEWLRGRGKVDEGASMGIVFTSLFALGIILLRRYADAVDLDPDCVLNGMLETSVGQDYIVGHAVPQVFVVLSVMFVINLLTVVLLYKELKISSFDPQLATTLGINARVMHYLLMSLTALTTVAAFEAVGPILVIAMLIVPAACAYLLTDRLPVMIGLSLIVAAVSALLGHVGATALPRLVGLNDSTTTVGMMASATGVIFMIVMLASPRHGIVARAYRRRSMSRKIITEDVLAIVYRATEDDRPATPQLLMQHITRSGATIGRAVQQLLRQGLIATDQKTITLTPDGLRVAQQLVRSHRLWEQYLSEHTSVAADHLHSTAERLEHVTDPELRKRLADQTSQRIDPHGRSIPGE
jgi:manganese/zinc/iron transport system permease protein